ncbi:MAG: type 1 glutamine amidotransferase [Clostridia bacterium]|nr:type 1 glutamine amidotransferase [Deltaproteobacteria bacterium]
MARIGFILGDMFEESEFHEPYEAVKQAGHEAIVIGVKPDQEVRGKNGQDIVKVDQAIMAIDAKKLDALVIPGGYSPDHLRTNHAMVTLVRLISESAKPLAAICHGPSIFVDADILKGRTVTSAQSIKADLVNAGARWVDQEISTDDNILTSRQPSDLPKFCAKLLEMVSDRVGNVEKQTRARNTGESLSEH